MSRVFFDASVGAYTAEEANMADLINDFDDTLFLEVVPQGQRDIYTSLKPYRIVQRHPNFPEYTVMEIGATELDHRVLASLFNAREAAEGKVGTLADRLENEEAAAEIVRLKARNEEREELRDKARFLMRTPFHTPTMDGKKFRL